MRRITCVLLGAALVLVLSGCSRKIPVAGGAIVFLGDSITAGYGLDPAQAYPALIKIPGMTMVNLGVSGNTSEDGLPRLKDYLAGSGNPRVVVLALGANDILHGASPTATEANLNRIIAECKAHGIPVLLCGVKIPFKFDTDAIFQDVAKQNHVPLIPDLLMGEAFQDHLLQEDHAHPTAEGQKLIAEKIQAALLRSFSFQSPYAPRPKPFRLTNRICAITALSHRGSLTPP